MHLLQITFLFHLRHHDRRRALMVFLLLKQKAKVYVYVVLFVCIVFLS